MTLRNNCTPEQLRAHAILDSARAGLLVPDAQIIWALTTLGDDMTDNELPPSYPACFEGPQQFDGWRDSARRVSEESNPCDDCTAEYAARMRDEGRCDREYVQERFVINKRKKRIGVVA